MRGILSIDEVYLLIFMSLLCVEEWPAMDSFQYAWPQKFMFYIFQKDQKSFQLNFSRHLYVKHLVAYVIALFVPSCDLVPITLDQVPPFTSLKSVVEKKYDRCLVCSLEYKVCACYKYDTSEPLSFQEWDEDFFNIVMSEEKESSQWCESIFNTPFPQSIAKAPISKLVGIFFMGIEALHFQTWYQCKHKKVLFCVIKDDDNVGCFLIKTDQPVSMHVYQHHHHDFKEPTYPLTYIHHLHNSLSSCIDDICKTTIAKKECDALFLEAPKWLPLFCNSLVLPNDSCESNSHVRTYDQHTCPNIPWQNLQP